MSIFKAYDIRGVWGEDLNEGVAEKIGRAAIKFTKAKKIVVGFDSRTSSQALFNAFSRGVINSGASIVFIGLVSKPCLNWVSIKGKFDLGVMITASHNPKEYNGFNFMWGKSTLHYENGLNKIETYSKGAFKDSKRRGKITSRDYIEDYVKELSKHLVKKKIGKVKLVGDASGGASGEILKRFFEKNKIDCELIFTEPDGTFSCHDPNPLNDGALSVLRRKVVENKADFGFIVDPDADRARFVDEKGNIIDNSYIQSLVIKDMLKKHRKSAIVRELTARKIVPDTIKRNGGVDVMSCVGHPYVIDLMIKHKASYGCEMSGHNFFREMYNLDSGELMMVHVLNMYLASNKRMSKLVKPLGKYYYPGELTYKLKYDTDKVILIDKIRKYFEGKKKRYNVTKIFEMDGVSVICRDFWFNVRPSNTEPVLRFRIEGKNKKIVEKARKDVEKILG